MCVSVEASVHGTSIHCSDKTFEAAEALLRMDSPSSLREDRSPGNTEEMTCKKQRRQHSIEMVQLESDIFNVSFNAIKLYSFVWWSIVGQ